MVGVDGGETRSADPDDLWLVGDHPLVGEASLRAGAALVEFLDAPTGACETVFLISGGASAACAHPAPPLGIEDLEAVFEAAVRSGLDITSLNQVRAATSLIAGGAILSHVRSPRSRALIMVDNLVSGAAWVASGLTYHYRPTAEEFEETLERLRLDPTLSSRLREAHRHRQASLTAPEADHRNQVLLAPDDVLEAVTTHAAKLGYEVITLGRPALGDPLDEAAALHRLMAHGPDGPTCVVAIGEVAVRVGGSGLGGRCQEMAWTMAPWLEDLGRDALFVARATDGRDFLPGVAGAWVDSTTAARAQEMGLDHGSVLAANDSFHALGRLNQLLRGGTTGWNLCDLYLGLLGPR